MKEIFIVHITRLSCVDLNLVFFWLLECKSFGNELLQPDDNSEDSHLSSSLKCFKPECQPLASQGHVTS